MTAVDAGRELMAALIVVAVLSAAGCHRHAAPGAEQVRVEVVNVGLDRDTGSPFVLLEDKPGKRQLPIWIGESEARAIMLELHGINPQRPLTSDLLRTLIEKTGNHVDRVVIDDLRDQTYYADIYLNHDRYRIDSRPSDAIALALGVKAPIYVAVKLFESAGGGTRTSGPEAAHALGITVQELSGDIATYFNVAPESGVLVADVKAEAARAGVERGDVLTRIGKRQVRNLREFDRELQALAGSDAVALTLQRGGRELVVQVKLRPAAGS